MRNAIKLNYTWNSMGGDSFINILYYLLNIFSGIMVTKFARNRRNANVLLKPIYTNWYRILSIKFQ